MNDLPNHLPIKLMETLVSNTLSRALLSLVVALLSVTACGDDPAGVNAPVVLIASPATGSTFQEGDTVTLRGTATDFEDGPVPGDALSWSSSIDGTLGTGSELVVANLAAGLHTITLSAADADGNEGTSSITIEVVALSFMAGVVGNAQIGLVVNSTGNAIRLFQLGDPAETREIALGASSTVTATGISVRGTLGVVPLGNAASVAVLDLSTQEIDGFYLFPSGNATGSAFVDDRTVIVANQLTDEVGRFSLDQSGTDISETVSVTQFPTDVIAVSDSLVLVVSGNLDDAYAPAGEGMVTAVDPRTMTVMDTVRTGGQNPQFADLGPDGLLYVVNTGDYVSASTVAVINPATMTRLDVVGGFLAGSGDIHVDAQGLVYVSAFFGGTVVWNSSTGSFERDATNPVCAPLTGSGCRGAFAAHTDADGALYQTFFGSAADGLEPQIFRYAPESFALTDSIASGLGPVALEIATFR
jgi:hypothetical protein